MDACSRDGCDVRMGSGAERALPITAASSASATLLLMAKVPSLVEQIERDALNVTASLADALRKCVALGGQAGSEDLRDWASRELQGYEGASDVPAYRTVVAPIVIDGFSGNLHITGQQISVQDLPDVARGSLSEEIVMRQGVGELEELIPATRASRDPIRLGLPGGPELAKLMTYELRNHFRAVKRIYWNVSSIALVGVLDQIRNRLVALVAEVRAVTPDPASPSGKARHQCGPCRHLRQGPRHPRHRAAGLWSSIDSHGLRTRRRQALVEKGEGSVDDSGRRGNDRGYDHHLAAVQVGRHQTPRQVMNCDGTRGEGYGRPLGGCVDQVA